MIGKQRQQAVFVPIYNGTYFSGLFKLAIKLSTESSFKFIFFFGRSYPGQQSHVSLLEGKFKYLISASNYHRQSRVLSLASRNPLLDEFITFFELAFQCFHLRRELCSSWKDEKISLCIFPADNRYLYSFISSFARSQNTKVIVVPQWFAGPKEIEESLGHSAMYKPGKLQRFIIRLIGPKYLRSVKCGYSTFQMIPVRFSEILMSWLTRSIPPEPWILHSGFSDQILVETSGAYSFAQSLGFREQQISLTGSVYLDEINATKSLTPKGIRLLVAVAPDMFLSRKHANLQFESYEEFLGFLCSELVESGYQEAVFSMHPSDSGQYDQLIEDFGFSISRSPLHLLLVEAQIFLATISATIQWAEYLGIPTVNFDFYRYNYPDYLSYHHVLSVQNKESLKLALTQAKELSNLTRSQEISNYNTSATPPPTSLEKILFKISTIAERDEKMSNTVLIIDTKISEIRPEHQLPLIRVGRDNDGGYVIPRLILEKTSFLFSGGYGNDFSFERDFLIKSKASSAFLYDFSITLPKLLVNFMAAAKATLLRRDHYAMSYYLTNIYTYLRLMVTPRISLIHAKLSSSTSTSGGGKVSDLRSALDLISTNVEDSFFCKLDIEGYEYELIDELVELEGRIDGLVIEFHDTFSRRATFIASLNQLRVNYAVLHTHVNNYGGVAPDGEPVVFEVTFLNRRLITDSISAVPPKKSLVIHDQPNDPKSAEIELIFN